MGKEDVNCICTLLYACEMTGRHMCLPCSNCLSNIFGLRFSTQMCNIITMKVRTASVFPTFNLANFSREKVSLPDFLKHSGSRQGL